MTAKKSAIVKTKTKTKKATAKKATAKKAPVPKAKAKKAATAAPKPKPKTKTKKAAAAKPKKKAAAVASRSKSRPTKKVASTRPSGRATAVIAQLPQERALTDEEREAMAKCAQTALAALDVDGVPAVIVSRIGGFVDEVRTGHRPEPSSQDVRLGLGVLWGEQVRAQVGWRWVHLSYPNGFASYALVPDDRAFACFPLNRFTDLMRSGGDAMNTAVPLFDSIRIGALPARRENAYLVIG